MNIAVLKFGGTSVENMEARIKVCQRIEDILQEGYKAVVVISAMGRAGAPYATDTLLDLILKEAPNASPRELDLAFSCGEILSSALITAHLQQRGHKAKCLTGQQAGIFTDETFGCAQLKDVDTQRIRALLKENYVVVVSGGQGVTAQGEVTSLGRGSSDITCCALGVALDATRMDIFTDVTGVMTADPKLVPEARVIERMSHQECVTVARRGAKVIHPLSVEIALCKPHIPLRVRSTFEDHPGTIIGETRPSVGQSQ